MRSLSFVLAAHGISATLTSNLNYLSPSARSIHINLGLDTEHIHARSYKRGNVAFAPEDLFFTHGVASGDPFPNSVILWTRVAPQVASDQSNVTVTGTVPLYNHDTEQYIAADANPVCVDWKVWEQSANANGSSLNGSFAGPTVSSGTAFTTSDIDYTIKAWHFWQTHVHIQMVQLTSYRLTQRALSLGPHTITNSQSADRVIRVPWVGSRQHPLKMQKSVKLISPYFHAQTIVRSVTMFNGHKRQA